MATCITDEQTRDRFRALCDQVDAAHTEMRELCSDTVGNAFRVEFAERLETAHRTNRGLSYRVFGELHDPPDGTDEGLGDSLSVREQLRTRLRITAAEIRRRAKIAARAPT